MTPKDNLITRRDFLRGSAGAAFAAAVSPGALVEKAKKPEPAGKRSRVVLIRDADVLDAEKKPKPEVIQRMMDEAVKALFEVKDAQTVWRRLIKPTDLVGIKTNVWRFIPTPKALEDAIKRRVLEAGVPAERIRMDDRGARGTLADCTALVNARPLRTHHWAGIGGCIKNYVMFVNPGDYHVDACAQLGHVWTLPSVKGKTRLNVLVVLRPQFHGVGPHHYSSEYQWDYKGLLVSQDPVAVDAIGVELLTAKRKEHFGEDKPFPQLTHHVVYAETRHHIGVAERSRIDLIKLGFKDGRLI